MSTYFKDFWNRRFLLKELVLKGIRLKYRKSYLGIIWSLIEPLLTTVVLVTVFGVLFNRLKDPSFPVYIMCGRLIYSFFSTGTKGACKEVRKNSSMIKKVYVPKYIFTLSKVTSCFVNFLFSLGALPVSKKTAATPSFFLFFGQTFPGKMSF